MKKIIIGCFLLLVVTISQSFAADLGGYTISNYDSNIIVNSDGSLDVIETIDVNFSEPRRGIFRTIPTSNQGWPRAIENLQAQGDTYVDQSDSSFYKIRIGDANITLTGPKTYKITYHVKNGIRYINESGQSRQELYRNIVGNDRNTTIDQVKFRVTLFSGLNNPTETFVYYGNYGDKLTGGAVIGRYTSTQIIGGLKNNILQSRQGLTIGIKLPSDYIKITPEYEAIWNKPIINNNKSAYNVSPQMRDDDFILFVVLLIFGSCVLIFVILGLIQKGNKYKSIIHRSRLIAISFPFGSLGVLVFIKMYGYLSFFILLSGISLFFLMLHYLRPRFGFNSGRWLLKKPATIEYLPPKGYSLPQLAMFYHYEGCPEVITSLIYYRATMGWVRIKEIKKNNPDI